MLNLIQSHLSSGIVLMFLGLIFLSDALLDLLGYKTISEVTTDWINSKPENIYIFLGLVYALIIHFLWMSYKQ